MDDDIERLLREVEALEGKRPASPAPKSESAPEPAEGGSGRMSWTLVSALGGGGAGFLVGLLLGFLPWVSAMSTAIGAALGAALVALIAGPPSWFGR